MCSYMRHMNIQRKQVVIDTRPTHHVATICAFWLGDPTIIMVE